MSGGGGTGGENGGNGNGGRGQGGGGGGDGGGANSTNSLQAALDARSNCQAVKNVLVGCGVLGHAASSGGYASPVKLEFKSNSVDGGFGFPLGPLNLGPQLKAGKLLRVYIPATWVLPSGRPLSDAARVEPLGLLPADVT